MSNKLCAPNREQRSRSDFLVVGGGPGGIGVALKLAQLHPNASITILEQGGHSLSDFKGRGYTTVQSWYNSSIDPDFFYLVNSTDGYGMKLGKGLGGGTLHFGLQFIDSPQVVAKGYAEWSQDFEKIAELAGAQAHVYNPATHSPNSAWNSLRTALERVQSLQVYNNKVYSSNLAAGHRILLGDLLPPSVNVKYATTVKKVNFKNGRATGVESFDGEHFDANVVVLSGGAIQTPAMLQRSGIPAGNNLMSHAAFTELYMPPNTTYRTVHVPAQKKIKDIAFGLPVFPDMNNLNTDPNRLFAYFDHATLSEAQVQDARNGIFTDDSSITFGGSGYNYIYDLGNFFSGVHPGGNKYILFPRQWMGWERRSHEVPWT